MSRSKLNQQYFYVLQVLVNFFVCFVNASFVVILALYLIDDLTQIASAFLVYLQICVHGLTCGLSKESSQQSTLGY